MKTCYALFATALILLALSACAGSKKGASAAGQPTSNIQATDMAPPAPNAAGVTFPAITFEPALTQLDTAGRRTVGKLATYLLENPAKGVQLKGFATEFTRSKLNESLAAQRVEKVIDTLVQLKVGLAQIGYSANPIFEQILPGTVRWGRTNFRVEVEIRAKDKLMGVPADKATSTLPSYESPKMPATSAGAARATFRLPYARPSAEMTLDTFLAANDNELAFWSKKTIEALEKGGFKKSTRFELSGATAGWAIATEPQYFFSNGTPDTSAPSTYTPPGSIGSFEEHLMAYSRLIRERNGLSRIFVLTCSNVFLPASGIEFVYNDKKGYFETGKNTSEGWGSGKPPSNKYALRLLVYEFGSAPGKLPKQLIDVRKASFHADMSGLSTHVAELSGMIVNNPPPSVDQFNDYQSLPNPEPFRSLNPRDFHVVARGDTLYNISRRYKLTVEQLKKLNNLASNDIEIGQYLRIR